MHAVQIKESWLLNMLGETPDLTHTLAISSRQCLDKRQKMAKNILEKKRTANAGQVN